MLIELDEIKKVFCQENCFFYSKKNYCTRSELCPFRGVSGINNSGVADKILNLVTKDYDIINPEEVMFHEDDIIGIVLRYDLRYNVFICIELKILDKNCFWHENKIISVKTTLDDPIKNMEIIKKINPTLDNFLPFKIIEEYGKLKEKQYILGSSYDFLELGTKEGKIIEIMEKYNLNNYFYHSNWIWTSSVDNKNICIYVHNSNYSSVRCKYYPNRNIENHILPMFIIPNNMKLIDNFYITDNIKKLNNIKIIAKFEKYSDIRNICLEKNELGKEELRILWKRILVKSELIVDPYQFIPEEVWKTTDNEIIWDLFKSCFSYLLGKIIYVLN